MHRLMPGRQPLFKTPEEVEAVFYEAFQRGDAEVMAALWADGDVICVHPGYGPLVGYDTVTRSWAAIFDNVEGHDVEVRPIKCTVSDELAVHVVVEKVSTNEVVAALVLATNIYRKFDQGWMMIEHHGSVIDMLAAGETLQ